MSEPSFREIRDFSKNPPAFAPGMEDSGVSNPNQFSTGPEDSSPFGSPMGSSPGPSQFNPSQEPSSSPFGSQMGSRPMFNGSPLGAAPRPPLGINQQPQQAQQPPKAWDEEMRDKTMSIFGALYKTLSLSRGTMSAYAKSHFGFRTLCVGAGTTMAGFVEFVVNLVTGGYCGGYYALLFAGVATSAVGLGFWSAYYKKGAQEREEYLEAKKQAEQAQPAQQSLSQPQPASMFNSGPQQDQGFFSEDAFEGDDADPFGSSNSFDSNDDDDDNDTSDDQFSNFLADIEEADEDDDDDQVDLTKTPEEILEESPKLDEGVYTRQYLVETYKRVLPRSGTNLEMRNLDDESDEFEDWGSLIKTCVEMSGLDPERTMLDKVDYNDVMYRFKILQQPGAGSKIDTLAKQIENTYKMPDGLLDQKRESATATATSAGGYIYVTLTKGSEYCVTLADAWKAKEDDVMNTKIDIPWMTGVNQEGMVWDADLLKVDSFLTAGMPRTGKSWSVLKDLAQMCMFMPPSKLHIYICDMKTNDSAYQTLDLPHIKGYTCGAQNILNFIRWIVNEEGPRRAAYLGKYNDKITKIQDFNEQHPDDEMPYLYIIMDEMKDLMGTLQNNDKDAYNELKNYLGSLVTKYPAVGIRTMFIPHRVVDNIIPKTVSSMVQCRSICRASEDDVKSATDATPKQFPYKLPLRGDQAMRVNLINGDNVFFNHSVTLSMDERTNEKIFKVIGGLWRRIEPSEKGYWDVADTFGMGRLLNFSAMEASEGRTADGTLRVQGRGATVETAGAPTANPAAELGISVIPNAKSRTLKEARSAGVSTQQSSVGNTQQRPERSFASEHWDTDNDNDWDFLSDSVKEDASGSSAGGFDIPAVSDDELFG